MTKERQKSLNKVIITGASGPLGVVMVETCVKEGIQVVALVRPNSPKIEDIPIHPLVTLIEYDISKIDTLQLDIARGADCCFHFAWMHTGDVNRENPILQEKNIEATLKTAVFAHRMGCRQFVGAGSQAEYGIINHIINEETPTDPTTMYGIAKFAAGKMLMEYCRRVGMQCNWIRIFSVYGPYENDYILTSYLIRSYLNGEIPRLTPCEQVWDYLYCKDAIKAFLLVAERATESGLYCLGSGSARKLKDYVLTIKNHIDPDLSSGIGTKQYGKNQIMHLEANISKIYNDVGFSPEYSFEEGIAETINWYKKKSKKYKG